MNKRIARGAAAIGPLIASVLLQEQIAASQFLAAFLGSHQVLVEGRRHLGGREFDANDTTRLQQASVLVDQPIELVLNHGTYAIRYRRMGVDQVDQISKALRRSQSARHPVVIVFAIVVMSVVNTVSMAIMERTREIGTLRALGMKRYGVTRLFACESMMLGLFGSALGIILTLVTWSAVKLTEPTWVPPQISRRVPLEVRSSLRASRPARPPAWKSHG